jgi:hypothetical protein
MHEIDIAFTLEGNVAARDTFGARNPGACAKRVPIR